MLYLDKGIFGIIMRRNLRNLLERVNVPILQGVMVLARLQSKTVDY